MVVLADTHSPRRWKTCPPAVAACLREAGLIQHAGDVCTARVLDELAGYAPVCGPLRGCEDVAASEYSRIGGIPVAVYGVILSLTLLTLGPNALHMPD